MRNLDDVKNALKNSQFRASFKLNDEDKEYIKKIGLPKIESHAKDFLRKRVAIAHPPNDGKQTPYKGHPVFKAQHATGICCRGCLFKWYNIPKERELTKAEKESLLKMVMDWVRREFYS